MRFEDVLWRSQRSELSQTEAAELLGVSERTFVIGVTGIGSVGRWVLPHDLSCYPLDGPLPELPAINGGVGRLEMIRRLGQDGLSLGAIAHRMLLARGHWTVIGTPTDIADEMQRWFANHACDGFNILAPFHPGGLEAFVDLVVPELQRRGLFRDRYAGHTLRDHLGLERPPNRFVTSATARALA